MKSKTIFLSIVVTLIMSCSSSQISPPVLISENQPYYPLEAELNGLEGESKLSIKVSEEGVVELAVVRESAGSEILDIAAVEYALNLVFVPATKDDKPIEVWLTWSVDFRQNQFWGMNNLEALYDVLVFTKTTEFRHKSIQEGVNALIMLAGENDFDLDVTSNSSLFTDKILSKYEAIIFLNTSGNVLGNSEQKALEKFIQNGGGFVGIHAATDTEYEWPWYGGIIGAYFDGHPEIQRATINVIDRSHISTAHLPEKWERMDEWYNLRSDLPDDITVLALLDEDTYEGGKHGSYHPFSWYHEYDGGRAWITLGGHTKESYKEVLFLNHILGGIKYAADVD